MSKYPVWTMRLSDETKARWSEYAEAEQLSLPEFVRRCVEDVIEGRVPPRVPAHAIVEDFRPHAPSVMRAIPARKTQLELEAEEMDRLPVVRPNPFSKKGS